MEDKVPADNIADSAGLSIEDVLAQGGENLAVAEQEPIAVVPKMTKFVKPASRALVEESPLLSVEESMRALKTTVVRKTVVPHIEADIQDIADWRQRWRKVGNFMEFLAKVAIGVATVMAFASGFYGDTFWAFAAGISNTVALIFGQFGTYANGQSKERTAMFNQLLQFAGVKLTVPDLVTGQLAITAEA